MTALARSKFEAIKAALTSGVVDQDAATRLCGGPIRYQDEFLELYQLLDDAGRAELFPLIDPKHYARVYGVPVGDEQVLDFLLTGPLMRKWPHPLIRFDFSTYVRPDLTRDLETARELFFLIEDGTLALSPWLSLNSVQALAQLRAHQLDPAILPWVDMAHLRASIPHASDDWSAILQFASVEDARGAAPSKAFVPHIWAEAAKRHGPRLNQPFLDFLWQGRIKGFPSEELRDHTSLDGQDLVQYTDQTEQRNDSRFQPFEPPEEVGDNVIHLLNEPPRSTLAVAVHVFYEEMVEGIVERLTQAALPMTLFVTTPQEIETQVKTRLDAAGLPYQITVTENRGRDIAPFLTVLPQIIEAQHAFVLKLHTKRSKHRKDGSDWGDSLLAALTDPALLHDGITAMSRDANLGFIGPSGHVLPVADFILSNAPHVSDLVRRLGLNTDRCRNHGHFVAGSMFLARTAALTPVLSLGLKAEDFEPEQGQVDGTLAHAIERVMMLAGWRVDQKLMIQGSRLSNQRNQTRFYRT